MVDRIVLARLACGRLPDQTHRFAKGIMPVYEDLTNPRVASILAVGASVMNFGAKFRHAFAVDGEKAEPTPNSRPPWMPSPVEWPGAA